MMRRKIKLKMSKLDNPKVGKAGVASRLDRLTPASPRLLSGCKEQTKVIAKKLVSGGDKPEEFVATLKHFARKVLHSATEQLEKSLRFQGKPPAQSGPGTEADRGKWEQGVEEIMKDVVDTINQVFQTDYPKKKLEKLPKEKRLKDGVWQLFKQATPQLRHALDVMFTQGKVEKMMQGKKNRFEVMLAHEIQDAIDTVFDKKKLDEALNAKNLDEFTQKIGEAIKKDNEGKVQKAVYTIIRTTQKSLGKEKDTDLPEVLNFLKQPPPQKSPQKVTDGDKNRFKKQPKPENLPLSMFGMVLQGIRKAQQEWEKEKEKKEDKEIQTPFTIPTPWDS